MPFPTYQRATVVGPKGQVTRNFEIDTGATDTILPQADADGVGLPTLAQQNVQTDNGDVAWGISRATLIIRGYAVEVPLYLAPDRIYAIGDSTLNALQAQLQLPPQAEATPKHYTQEQRQALCESCEYLEAGPLGIPRCSLCRCPIWSKTRTSKDGGCPDGRW